MRRLLADEQHDRTSGEPELANGTAFLAKPHHQSDRVDPQFIEMTVFAGNFWEIEKGHASLLSESRSVLRHEPAHLGDGCESPPQNLY